MKQTLYATIPLLWTTRFSSAFLPSFHPRNPSTQSSLHAATSPTEAVVDMNQYNLDLQEIAQEWTAELVPESSLREGGVYLGAKNSKNIMVDTLRISFPRRKDQGLGLELLEIAGGRSDGLGITVIDGIVPGGCADGSELMVGDSIVSIGVQKTSQQATKEGSMSISEWVDTIDTECFGYDKLVDVIVNELPPAESEDNDETFIITVKRLRRKPKVSVKLQYPPSQNEPDTTIELFAGENLRRAMLTRGVKLNDPLSARFDSGGMGNCGAEGSCATCVVAIQEGADLLNPQGIQEAQILTKQPRWRFACKAVVGHGMKEGDMTIRVNPRQWDD